MSDGWEDASAGGWEDAPIMKAFSGWEDAPVSQEAPGLLDFLMGAPRKGMPQSKIASAARTGLGPLEAAASFGTGMGGAILGQAQALNAGLGQAAQIVAGNNPAESRGPEQAFNEVAQGATYQPRTPGGQEGAEALNEAWNRYGVPISGLHLPAYHPTFKTFERIEGNKPLAEMSPEFKGLDALDTAKEISPVPESPQQPTINVAGDKTAYIGEQPARINEAPEVTDQARQLQQQALEQQAKEAAFPQGEQIPLFGEENLPHETNPEGQLTRQPEQTALDLGQFLEQKQAVQQLVATQVEALQKRFQVPKNQRGQLNMDIFNPDFQAIKDLANGIRLVFQGDEGAPHVTAYKNGVEVGSLKLSGENIIPDKNSNLKADWVDNKSGSPGLAKQMYEFAAEKGNDIVPSKVQTPEGKAMWQGFEKGGTSQGMKVPRGQRGGVDFSFGEKRNASLLEEENRQAKDMLKMANTREQQGAWDYLANTADKWFNDHKHLLDKVQKLQDLSPYIQDQHLNQEASHSFARLQDAFARFQEALHDPEKAALAAVNVKYLMEDIDHKHILNKYVEAIQEARKSLRRDKTSQEMGKAIDNVLGNTRTIPKSQRGGVDYNNITESVGNVLKAFGEGVSKMGNMNLHHLTSKEDYLAKNIPGLKESLKDVITPSDPPAKIIADSLKPEVKDMPKMDLSANFQSGLELTAAKYRDHPLLLGVGRVLNEAVKKTELQIKQLAKPVMEKFSTLPTKEKVELTQLFKREMFNNKRYSAEELHKVGFSKKQTDAYIMMRAAHDAAFEQTNLTRGALGKEPITKGNAYLASMRNGDWHFSVVDKNGRPAWYVREATKADAIAALNHLKKNFGDSLKLEGVEPEFRKGMSQYHPDMPRDVMGAYQDMLKYFSDNPHLSGAIKESMQHFLEEKGYNALNHKTHFMEKQNVRGFEGDKPWLSERENANALMKAQNDYLKSALQWSHSQESIAKIKELVSNPELLKAQPNAVDFVQKVTANQFGLNQAVMKGLENSLAQLLPAMHGYNPLSMRLGRSTSSLYKGASGIKTALYLQLLGLNLSHAIATPLQSLFTTPAQHRLLTTQGFKHNVAKTTLLATSDFFSGMAKHFGHDMTGQDISVPMTDIGLKALKYAEDNGIIEKNVFNESVNLGDNKIGAAAKKVLGSTISVPEKATRLATFLGFVHHLEASGKFKDSMEMMRRAEELTDRSLTSFRRPDRPLIVDKLGATGSLAYTFKSYLFNEFNQLSQLSREASRGTVTPLLSHLGMMALIGGVLSLPSVNEMDGLWNVFKDFISEHMPEHYNKIKGNGLKAAIISSLPDTASYGAASTLTGKALQSRFGTDVVDPEKPFKNLFPMAQDIKEAVSSVGALTHPNKTTATEAVYQQMPALIKGQMETNMDVFKGPQQKGGQVAINPNNLIEHRAIDKLRTPEDIKARQMGMVSLPEAKARQTGYINAQESQRIKTATDKIGEHLFDAIIRKSPDDIKEEAQKYLELNPSPTDLQRDIVKRIDAYAFTPSERSLIKANTYKEVMNVVRLMRTRGELK